jgi:hypothetical protein
MNQITEYCVKNQYQIAKNILIADNNTNNDVFEYITQMIQGKRPKIPKE